MAIGRQAEAALSSFVGREAEPWISSDPINEVMIHHWCQVFENRNPAYLDASFASRSRFGQIISPPAMTQAWVMRPYGEQPPSDAVSELYDLLDQLGYHAIVATNSRQTHVQPQFLGESLRSTKRIVSISEEKNTRLGAGRFITSEVDVVGNDGSTVATQVQRHLKFRPRSDAGPPTPPAPAKRRPRPVVTQDTAFYFEGAKSGQLLVQRCATCARLQHPPWPSCSTCQSLSLHPVAMSGRGLLYSFTVVHAPVVEPFEPPYLVGLVELEEGPRVVAGLLGVGPEEASIGMPLRAAFARFDADLTLPVFRPETSRDLDVAGTPYPASGADRTLSASDIAVGGAIPELTLPMTHTFITAAALATRDFQPVHHDTNYAAARGMPDVITNIWSTQAIISRWVTDWSGPEATPIEFDLRLGDSNYPGDVLVLSGRVSSVVERPGTQESAVTIELLGRNGHGVHVSGHVVCAVPGQSPQVPEGSNR